MCDDFVYDILCPLEMGASLFSDYWFSGTQPQIGT